MFLALALVLVPLSAGAQERRVLSRADLMGLAQKFVDRIGGGLVEADRRLMIPADTTAERQLRAFRSMEDGEELLMQVRIDRLSIDRTILGIKQGSDIMLSLGDFVAASDFAIIVDPVAQKAEGFFIREEQKFSLDIPGGKVVAADRSFALQPGDTEIVEGDILVKSAVMARWFDFTLVVDLSMQQLNITSAKKWPVQERFERFKKKNMVVFNNNPVAKLPELKEDYKEASFPNVDVNIRQTYVSDPAEEKTLKTTRYGIQAAGDLAKHAAVASISGNKKDKLESVYLNMKRESDEPDLLGVLQARRYEFGDINTVIVPNAGNAPSEIGVRASNRNPFVTSATTTRIAGFSTIGWDVELYRNNQYLAIETVDETGQYIFNDVSLVSGLNTFKIVQFGPLGEIREEQQVITVDPNVYASGGIGIYDVSASLQNTQTWRAEPSEDQDKTTPHLSGTLARQLTPDMSGHVGLRTRQENKTQKAYGNAGLAATVAGAIVNADVTVDDAGPYMGIVTARKTVDRQSFGAAAYYQSENFNPGARAGGKPAQVSLRTFSSGPIPFVNSFNYNYDWNSGYNFSDDGSSGFTDQLSLNARMNRLYFNNTLNHSTTNFANGDSEELLDGDFSVRGRALKAIWRAAIGYEMKPETGVTDYRAGVSRALSKTVQGDISVRHKTINNYTVGQLSLDWDGKKVQVSPSISYDTDDMIDAHIALRFGLTRDPYTGDILMRGKNVSGAGGVSARVFLDRDGDSLYSEGDELLEGVIVRAIQPNREAETAKNGEVFLYDLPAGELTDIFVEEGGSMDATWISGFPGVSVRPRPGLVSRLEFPIHMSGEIDGTLYAQTAAGKPRPLKNVRLGLYDETGKLRLSTKTANDGFYLFELVPPGQYYLISDPENLRTARVSALPPQPIKIGFDGTIIYGNDITYPAGSGVGFDMVSVDSFQKSYPDIAMPADSNVILNLGSYNSPLTMALVWYKFKMRYSRITEGLSPFIRLGDHRPDAGSGLYTLRLKMASGNIDEAFRRCRALAARDIFCTIEYIPGQNG